MWKLLTRTCRVHTVSVLEGVVNGVVLARLHFLELSDDD